jgi:hypothetical protein
LGFIPNTWRFGLGTDCQIEFQLIQPIDLAACLGTLEISKSGSPNSNTNRDSTLTLSEDY